MSSNQHRWRIDFDGTWQAESSHESGALGRKKNLWPGIRKKKKLAANDHLSDGRTHETRPPQKWLKPRWDSSMVYHARVPEEVLARLMVDQARAQESDPDELPISDSDSGQPALATPQNRKSRGKSLRMCQRARLHDHIAAKPLEDEGPGDKNVHVDIQGLVIRQEWLKLEQLPDEKIVEFGLDRLEKLLHLQGTPLLYGEDRLQRLRSAFHHEATARKKSMLGRYALFRAAAMDGVTLPQVPTAPVPGPEETLRPSKPLNRATPHLTAGCLPMLVEKRQGGESVSELAKSARGLAARRSQLDAAVAAR